MSSSEDQTSGTHSSCTKNSATTIKQIFLRPASLYEYLISRGPLLIGWDDDKFRDLVERSKTVSSDIETKDTFGEDRRKMEELKSDLSHIFVDALVMNLSQFILKDVQYADSNIDSTSFQGKKDAENVDKVIEQHVPLYDLLSQTIKYHRDSYLTGSTYANIQRFRRTQKYGVGQTHNAAGFMSWSHMPFLISKKEESSANLHLQGFIKWFIPSQTMIELVRPTVKWTISPPIATRTSLSPYGGPLYTPLVQAVTNLIPLSQTMVDNILKDAVIHLLKSPEWRLWVKSTTGGYVSRLQRDVHDNR